MRSAHVTLIAVAALLLMHGTVAAQTGPAESARRITLGETVRRAIGDSPDLAIDQKGVDAARARVVSRRRLRLPAIKLDANALYWNEELAFQFMVPGMDPVPGAEPLVVRDRLTTSTALSAALPLSAQLLISKLVDVEEHGLEAAKHDHSARKLEVAARAAQAYVGVLLAQAVRDIAETRTRLVTAQLERARVLAEGGVLGKVDVMRLEAALAAARRQSITATGDVETAIDGLVLLLDLPEGTVLAPVDDLPDAGTPPPMDVSAAVGAAVARRPELRAAKARAEQARAGAAVQKADMFPNILAIGTAQHTTGGGPFQPENSWFVGLQLSWNLWDWGATWNQYKAASHEADRAEMAADRAADSMRVAVRRTARQARAAYDALDVAKTGLTAADEAYRIQEVRFGEGAATTTDLLSAETELTQARTAYATARYAYFLELAALAQATGQLPDAFLTSKGSP